MDRLHRLIVIRHAKSDHPMGVSDHARPLTARGERDASRIGGWLTENVGDPDLATGVAVSTARRAQQTWGLLNGVWGYAHPVIDEPRIYEASPSTLRLVADELAVFPTILLVGHNPGLSLLVSELAAPSRLRSEAQAHFPTSAVAVLETDRPWHEGLAGTGLFELSSFGIPRG